MINLKFVKKYCKDYTLIANYDEAVNDTTQTWICHHILGEILSKQQLLDHDFYYDVPPCMLKFVTTAEHCCIHNKGKHHSDETKRKISESLTGKKLDEERCRRMSESFTGENNPFYGKHHSAEARRKMSVIRRGRTLTEEHRIHLSESLKGRTSPMKGKKMSEESRKKLSESHKGKVPWNKGKHKSTNN